MYGPSNIGERSQQKGPETRPLEIFVLLDAQVVKIGIRRLEYECISEYSQYEYIRYQEVNNFGR